MKKLTAKINKEISIEYKIFNENNSLPLVVYLHGFGEIRDRLESGERHVIPFPAWVNADHRKNFSYLIPHLDCLEKWSPLKIKTLIDYFIDKKGFNKNKIFLIGNSWGARGVWDVSSEYPETFAGLISIAGVTCPLLGDKLKNVPAILVHGEIDKTVDIKHSKDMYQALGGDNSDIHEIYTLPKRGHSINKDVLKHNYIWEWMKEISDE